MFGRHFIRPKKEGPMHTVTLLVALTTVVVAPDGRCGRGGGRGHGRCHGGGCYSGGCGYGGGGCGYGGYGGGGCGVGGCGVRGYGFGGHCGGVYSGDYGKPVGETDKKTEQKKEKKSGEGDEDKTALLLPAQIVVTLPADARLTFDDEATQSVGTKRFFTSPPLPRENTYSYTLKAEFVRDGKTVSVTKTASVTPGKETLVSFDDTPARSVASK
jgi:uncharacterized protein (TIGR03000 family)